MMLKTVLLISVFLVSSHSIGGALSYKHNETELESYLAVPTKTKPKMPAVLIVHDWMGISDFTKRKADEMAKKGFVSLAVDIYGKGQRPKDSKEAGALAGKFKSDRKLFRERLLLGLEQLKNQKGVDSKKIVVFGYCFGGTGALELGRSGADIAGIASFHGGLDNPAPQDAKNIKAKVLILHGAIDPLVPSKDVSAFQQEMNEAKLDYQFISYSGAVHAFTNPAAGNDIKQGVAYNELADKRSWIAFESFIQEVLK